VTRARGDSVDSIVLKGGMSTKHHTENCTEPISIQLLAMRFYFDVLLSNIVEAGTYGFRFLFNYSVFPGFATAGRMPVLPPSQ